MDSFHIYFQLDECKPLCIHSPDIGASMWRRRNGKKPTQNRKRTVKSENPIKIEKLNACWCSMKLNETDQDEIVAILFGCLLAIFYCKQNLFSAPITQKFFRFLTLLTVCNFPVLLIARLWREIYTSIEMGEISMNKRCSELPTRNIFLYRVFK